MVASCARRARKAMAAARLREASHTCESKGNGGVMMNEIRGTVGGTCVGFFHPREYCNPDHSFAQSHSHATSVDHNPAGQQRASLASLGRGCGRLRCTAESYAAAPRQRRRLCCWRPTQPACGCAASRQRWAPPPAGRHPPPPLRCHSPSLPPHRAPLPLHTPLQER